MRWPGSTLYMRSPDMLPKIPSTRKYVRVGSQNVYQWNPSTLALRAAGGVGRGPDHANLSKTRDDLLRVVHAVAKSAQPVGRDDHVVVEQDQIPARGTRQAGVDPAAPARVVIEEDRDRPRTDLPRHLGEVGAGPVGRAVVDEDELDPLGAVSPQRLDTTDGMREVVACDHDDRERRSIRRHGSRLRRTRNTRREAGTGVGDHPTCPVRRA